MVNKPVGREQCLIGQSDIPTLCQPWHDWNFSTNKQNLYKFVEQSLLFEYLTNRFLELILAYIYSHDL